VSTTNVKRADRVGQLIQQELGRLLVNGLRDPRVGFVTVTEVRPSPDLRNARVYISVYGTDAERTASIEGLRDAAGYLKRELSRGLKLRFTPNLHFSHDVSLDQAERLDDLFTAISAGATEIPEASERPRAPVQTTRTELAQSAAAHKSKPAPTRRRQRPDQRLRRRRKR